jgi:branched-chain amino acid transport system substrate-binding protein
VVGLALAGALVGGAAASTRADPGVTETSILVGGTAALSGEASFARGAAAYLAHVNRRGGVHGRTVTYRLVDDGGDPAQALAATQQLVEGDGVFAIFAAAPSVRSYLRGVGVPLLLDGFRPTRRAEGWILGSYLARTRPGVVVGVLHTADAAGRELLAGLRQGVARTRVRVLAAPLDPALGAEVQAAELQAAGAQALALFVPEPEAAAVAVAGLPLLVAADALGARRWPEGTVAIGWVKDPAEPRWRDDEGLRPYRSLLRGRGAAQTQGMAAAFELVRVLRAAGEEPTRAAVAARAARLIDASNPFLHPGIVVRTGRGDVFPIEQAVVRRVTGGVWRSVGGVWRHSAGSSGGR